MSRLLLGLTALATAGTLAAVPSATAAEGPLPDRAAQAGGDTGVRGPARALAATTSTPPQVTYSVAAANGSAVLRLNPLTGAVRTLVAAPRSAPLLFSQAWSAALGRVFYSRSGASSTTEAVDSVSQRGGAARREITGADALDVSRDGRRVVFSRTEGETSNLFVADRGGANARRLTGAGGYLPRFSPDDRRVVFSRDLPGSDDDQADLFVIGTDGRGLTRVTATTGRDEFVGSFSPDGRRLAFSAGGNVGDVVYDLRTVGLDGRGERLVRRNAIASDWAANGWLTYIAFRSVSESFEGPGQVAVRAPGVRGRETVLTRETSTLTGVRFAR